MAVDVVVPEVGETGMDVTLVRWCKAAGDPVAVGDILFELDTDKTVVEVEAWTAGTLVDLRARPGDVVAPQQVVARILTAGEAATSVPGESISAAPHAGDATPGAVADPSPAPGVTPLGPDSSGVPGGTPSAALPGAVAADGPGASPRARRLARERGVDLATVSGTGPGGLITERDVLAAAGGDPGRDPEQHPEDA